MRMHIIGVANAFMVDIALTAKRSGHEVVVSDETIPARVRVELEIAGIVTLEGFCVENIAYRPDLVIFGHGITGHNVEANAAQKQLIPCIGGAQWLEEHVVRDRWSRLKHASPPAPSKQKTVKKHAPRPSPAHPIKSRRIR